MSSDGSITINSRIASEFYADRGFVNFDKPYNLLLFSTCFQKYVNLISLFLGKLRVCSHLCSFDLGRSMKHRC